MEKSLKCVFLHIIDTSTVMVYLLKPTLTLDAVMHSCNNCKTGSSCHSAAFSVPPATTHFYISVSDGWAFTNNFDINQHQSLEDRLSAAQILVQKEPLCPVVVDQMDNVTAIKYGALPERLYVLQAGQVVYKVSSVRCASFQLRGEKESILSFRTLVYSHAIA